MKPDTLMHNVTQLLGVLFPQHPNVYFGRRSSTLLASALQRTDRNTLLMPGFICPHLSAMGQWAGKQLVHIDMDVSTMHPRIELIRRYLRDHSTASACLLIDHTFGYISPDVEALAREFPDLLIIEDCARALGGYYAQNHAGSAGDWIVLSMYKTTRGNEHGGLLLSRTPLPLESGPPSSRSSLREYLAGIPPLRLIHSTAKRLRPPLGTSPEIRDTPGFTVDPGLPSPLSLSRFHNFLEKVVTRKKKEHPTWKKLHKGIATRTALTPITIRDETQPAGHYLSFAIPGLPPPGLYLLLQRLYSDGYFLFNAWPDPPLYFTCFAGTYLYGDTGSRYLAEHIIHVPVDDFVNDTKIENFFSRLDKYLKKF